MSLADVGKNARLFVTRHHGIETASAVVVELIGYSFYVRINASRAKVNRNVGPEIRD